MTFQNGIVRDGQGNPVAPKTTAEQVITSTDGARNLAGDLAELMKNNEIVTRNKGWYVTKTALETAHSAGQNGDYAVVGETDSVWVWDGDTNKWVNTHKAGEVTKVNGKTGEVVLTKADLGLNNVDNTSDMDKPVSAAVRALLDTKAALEITGESAYTI